MTDHNYQAAKENVFNIRRKAALLQAYVQKCEDTTAQYSEYIKHVNIRIEDIRQRAQ